jgi:hypothetical protein
VKGEINMSYCENPCFDEFEFDKNCDFEPECHDKKFPEREIAIEAISVIPQTVAAGVAVPFTTNLVTSGNCIIHTPGSTDFNLVQPGLYRATFTGTVATDETTTAGVALAVNGSILPGTTVTETVIAGDAAALATQALIQVSPFMSTLLTVVNPTTGTETFTNPNIIIERIG